MRQQAIRIALSGKASGERIFVVDGLEALGPKTRSVADLFETLGVKSSALVVTGEAQNDLAQAVRNLPRIKAVRADLLSVLDLLRYDALVMTQDAVKRAEALWANTARVKKEVTAAG